MEIKAYINSEGEVEYSFDGNIFKPLDLAAFIIFAPKEEILNKFGIDQPTIVLLDPANPKLQKAKRQLGDGFDCVYKSK